MLAAGLPLKCVAITAPGDFDTHSDQAKAFDPGLTLTAQSLAAFQADLESRGLADRVLIHVWTEFGRRAQENGSGGTDHGAAGTAFVIGSRAAGGMVGEFPGLGKGLPGQAAYVFHCDRAAPVGSFVAGSLQMSPVQTEGYQFSIYTPAAQAATAAKKKKK